MLRHLCSLLFGFCTAIAIQAAPLVTSLVETGGDGAPTAKWTGETFTGPAIGTYTVPTFGVLSKAFCDRVHAWTNASGTVLMPSYLVGNPYIMIRNDNRENAGYKLEVTVSEDVLVYLLIDNRVGEATGQRNDPPFSGTAVTSWSAMQWVGTNGFRPVQTGRNRTSNSALPDEIGIDEGANGSIEQNFSIYTNRFPAGKVTFYQQGYALNMYGIVLVAVGPTAPPAAPTNLSAVSTDSQVTLTWGTPNGSSGFNVKRAETPGGPYTTIASTATATYTDVALVNGAAYYYVVSATNSLGEGPDSAEVIGAPNRTVTGIVAVGGTNQVTLNWNDLEVAESYSIVRSLNSNGPFATIVSDLFTTTYTDTDVLAGRIYYYRVSAPVIGGGLSGQSETVSAATAPSAPALTAAVFGSNAIALAWSTSDSLLSDFLIEHSVDGTTFALVGVVAGTERSWLIVDQTPGSSHFYRIQAQNSAGLSSYSTVASVTLPAFAYSVNFGTGPNNSAANPASIVPPGYANDIGEVFMQQANGWVYGWTNAAGTNIVRDARYRQNTNSADIRFDTFNHMQKSPGGAGWEIEVPNGYYRVRVVGGDPTATDSVFQYDIEGTITATHVPTAGNWWADFTTNAAVSDGKLTVWSGPAASNSKICFIDIYPDVPVAPSVVTPLQSQTVTEWRSFALTSGIAGSPLLQYQWYFNSAPIAEGTNSTLVFSRIREANEGSYYVVVTNYGGAITSDVAVLTVQADAEPPQVASVGSLNGWTIGLTFNEDIDTNYPGVTEGFFYVVNDTLGQVDVLAVTVRPDGRSVGLQLGRQISGSFTVDAAGIPDYAGNTDDSSIAAGAVLGFIPQDIGMPALPGSHFTSDGNLIEIVGGGADIWGNSDQGYIATKTVSGDFDLRMRVNALSAPNTITKAVILARETTNSDSRGLHVSVNPVPPGRDQTQFGYRHTTAGTTVAVGTNGLNAGVPNAWVRLVRSGSTFTGFRSSNGVDWVQLGVTNTVFPASMEVGFGITAHDNTRTATGLVSNITIDQAPAQSPVVNMSYGLGGFSGAIQTQSGVTYQLQYKEDLGAATWTPLATINGDGTVKPLGDADTSRPMRFYRIVILP